MSVSKETDNTTITRPASKVMLGGVLSLLGSLATNVIVAAIFGANADMDAYLTAMVIPTYFYLVFYSSLSFILVPAFIDAQTQKKEDHAWSLVGTFFWLTAATLISISVAGSICSAQIISITAPGFQGEKAALAAQMLSILMFATPFAGLGVLTVGIQNARNSFFLPSIASMFGAISNVITLLVLYPLIGPMALCWGYLVSTIANASVTIVPVLIHGWKRTMPLGDPRVVGLIKMMMPLIFFGLLNSFSPVAERYFSSGLPDGQISYMGYVNKISSIFVLVLAPGIAATIFPSMARAFAQNGMKALSEKNNFGITLSTAVALPTVLVVSAVSLPLVIVLFERGAFTHTDSIGVSLIIFPYFLRDVLFRMISNVLQRSFYVLKDATTQLITTSVFLVVYIATAGFFVTEWGYAGLVWAGTLRSGLSAVVIWFLLSRKLPKDHEWNILPRFLKYGLAAMAAYLGAYSIILALAVLPPLFQLLAGGLTGLLLYLTILHFLDREMFVSVVELGGFHFLRGHLQKGKSWFISGKLN